MDLLSYDQTYEKSLELFGQHNYLTFLLNPEDFSSAFHSNETIFVTFRNMHGLAIGKQASILSSWNTHSIESYDPSNQDWSFYVRTGISNLEKSKPASFNENEIEHFLKMNAPEASTWPGHHEIQWWSILRDDDGVLIATAAVVKWKSNAFCLVSMTVESNSRGMGVGRQLLRRILQEASYMQIDVLGLGVHSSNIAATKLYEREGFRKLHSFKSGS